MMLRHSLSLGATCLLTAILLAAVTSFGMDGAVPPSGRKPLVIGYVASWKAYEPGFRMADLRTKGLTHIIYAFGKVGPDGTVSLGDPCIDVGACGDGERPFGLAGNFAALASLKKRNPDLKVLVSLGGWQGSGSFSDAAASKAGRYRMARTAIQTYIDPYPGLFDGFDIDWEFPVEGGLEDNSHRPADKANFTALMTAFRDTLDEAGAAKGRRYLLSAAVSADLPNLANLQPKRLSRVVDWLSVMTYDYHADSDETAFNAPLFPAEGDPDREMNADASIRAYLRYVDPAKLVLGLPFYGRLYSGVDEDRNGLFQPGTPGDPDGGLPAEMDYRQLRQSSISRNGFLRFWSARARCLGSSIAKPDCGSPTTIRTRCSGRRVTREMQDSLAS
ncbi:Chitinase A1 precursor [Methyloligella halotolerans]|uniref:chitinase n=1 Tax=Methyloligella halotolerans TaxID=1177755 RepID=A0A1E2RZQ8_9HYPH|nr:glycoside hydrolase family 18 protein [Methyloligella halotolerans]ODA67727.1 Chitinase A1 precursor [Methyloligella halotolerans]